MKKELTNEFITLQTNLGHIFVIRISEIVMLEAIGNGIKIHVRVLASPVTFDAPEKGPMLQMLRSLAMDIGVEKDSAEMIGMEIEL